MRDRLLLFVLADLLGAVTLVTTLYAASIFLTVTDALVLHGRPSDALWALLHSHPQLHWHLLAATASAAVASCAAPRFWWCLSRLSR